jgi:hypothetical protein
MPFESIKDRIIWNVAVTATMSFAAGAFLINSIHQAKLGDATFIFLFMLIFSVETFVTVMNTCRILREL